MNSRIAQRREKILAYNNSHCTDALEFKVLYGSKTGQIVTIPEAHTMLPNTELKFNRDGSPNRKQLVRIILRMAENYGSYNPTTRILETGCGRNRSSLDIWRHAKSVYPDIDVFLIMEAIYALADDEQERIFGQYCGMVHRAVFNLGGPRLNHRWRCDEYKIMFTTWKKLHEETK